MLLLLLYDGHSAGAQIIDFMILVVDVVKGIQTQTAEVCILVCCIFTTIHLYAPS